MSAKQANLVIMQVERVVRGGAGRRMRRRPAADAGPSTSTASASIDG